MLIHSITHGDLCNFPKHMATVIATQGCDQACFYCHNPELIPKEGGTKYTEFPYTKLTHPTLKSRYVVITGGEPTLQPDLLRFLYKLTNNGYVVKLDTNSTYSPITPYIKHLSYVALDIKHFPQQYLKSNIAACSFMNIPFELRFTAYGNYHQMQEKIKDLIINLQTARKIWKPKVPTPIYLQNCNHPDGWSLEQIQILEDTLLKFYPHIYKR